MTPAFLAPFAEIQTPADRASVLASVKAAGDLGREVADLAVLMFGTGSFTATCGDNPGLRSLFDETMTAFLPDLFADWHGMQAEDRDYLQKIAAVVFDRRMALHRTASIRFGGEA